MSYLEAILTEGDSTRVPGKVSFLQLSTDYPTSGFTAVWIGKNMSTKNYKNNYLYKMWIRPSQGVSVPQFLYLLIDKARL